MLAAPARVDLAALLPRGRIAGVREMGLTAAQPKEVTRQRWVWGELGCLLVWLFAHVAGWADQVINELGVGV